MSVMKMLVLGALLATVASLVAGISSMATDSEVGRRGSASWMNLRVGFQALALLLMVIALLG